jgi:hypothetical protein
MFCWRLLSLIAILLKLCAAAALNVFNAGKGTYSVINEDYIIDNRHTILYITNSIGYFTFLLLPGRFEANTCDEELGTFVSLQQPIILLTLIKTTTERLDSELTQTLGISVGMVR